MSLTISAQLKAHYAGGCTTLARLWLCTLKNGVVHAFTDHNSNITFNSVEYLAASGFMPSSVVTSDALNVDNLEVVGMLQSPSITDSDLYAGLWDYASISIVEVNYNDLTMGSRYIRNGTIGQVKTGRSAFTAELRGMTQNLQQTVGRLCNPACDADLGDARCGINISAFTVTGNVVSIVNNRQWTDVSLIQANGYFTGGLITWTTGLNVGLKMEVKNYTVGNVLLQLPMPYSTSIGDAYSVTAGCDKSRAVCKTTFLNVVNHRGFPDVPGQDAILKGAP